MTVFEKENDSLGVTQPRICWVVCNAIPVCVAVDRLRSCTSAELSAFHFTQTESSTPLATDAQTQQVFIDERNSFDIQMLPGPSRPVDDDHDDEMSEPTQMTTAETRKVDETAKELRASLPITASPHARSSRSDDDETHGQFARSAKQARITKTEIAAL